MRDRGIVAAIVAGDPAGLAGAYDTYAESVYGYCVWLLGEPDRAADAVQDVFVIAAACLGGLGDPRRLRPWLYAVARNQCHRRLRAGQAGLDAAAGLAAPPADADENSERAGLRGLVRAALDGLTPGEREVIELGFRHDLSGADLAAVLGVSRNQAHALVSGARGRLERELGVPLVARTGRWACPTLALMLGGWDGPLTGPMRKQVARHTGQCAACAYRRRSALRPAVLDGVAPLAALPRDLREKVLRLCADHSPLARAYREEAAQRAGPFAARGFPRQVRQPRGRMLALAGAAAASVILIAIVAAGVITVLALGSRTPRPLGETSSHSGPAAASAAVTRTAGAARVSPGVSPAANQPETSAPPTVLVPSPSHPAPSSPPPPPTPSASASCPHPLPHHRCHRLGRARGVRPGSIWRLTCVEAVVAWDGFWAGDHNRDGSSEQSDGAGPGRAGGGELWVFCPAKRMICRSSAASCPSSSL
ncbi:MAG TPA: sigma-70 family RNA polymerase sigma factor [Streptosporangiaceae bacterium]|nr:sigma-70 family RNA polymerase sigma factor [Streptosporangiaceae bacterium]